MDLAGEITLNISFLEDGVIQKNIDHSFIVVNSSVPEISIMGSEIIQLRLEHHNYSEPGYSAKADDGTDVTETVQVIGVIDQAKPSCRVLIIKLNIQMGI